MISYDNECKEYAILWNILSCPEHVNNKEVMKCDHRKMSPSSEKVRVILDIAKFKHKTNIWLDKLYQVWLVHDKDDLGRVCIRMFCFTNNAMVYYKKKLFEDGINPLDLIMISCSAR
jgi:hypothetical protein